MSSHEVNAFLTDLEFDPALRERVLGLGWQDNSEALVQAVVVARDAGYDFTVEELSARIADTAVANPITGELPDKALDGVSGGIIAILIGLLVPAGQKPSADYASDSDAELQTLPHWNAQRPY